nr:SWIM zinc finger family protein [Streptomyces sp. HUCO-GS316]
MPAELVDDAREAGVPLLPQPTELDPECSCPDWGYPCKHAAALCYAIAATIDTDPFVLFALRGRSREEALAQLRTRRTATQATSTPPTPAGLPAVGAYAAWAALTEHTPRLPELPEPAPHTAALPAAPPPGTGLFTTDLERLIADAAARAAQLLTGATTGLHLTQHQDAVRIAANAPGPEWFHRLIQNTGAKPTAFARLTRAWRHGGPTGITVAEHPHTPDPTAMTARTALTEALTEMTTAPIALRAWRNRAGVGGGALTAPHGGSPQQAHVARPQTAPGLHHGRRSACNRCPGRNGRAPGASGDTATGRTARTRYGPMQVEVTLTGGRRIKVSGPSGCRRTRGRRAAAHRGGAGRAERARRSGSCRAGQGRGHDRRYPAGTGRPGRGGAAR